MEQYPTSASFSRSGSQDSISKESSTDENSFSLSSSLSMVRRSRSLTIVRDFLDDQLTAKIKETQVWVFMLLYDGDSMRAIRVVELVHELLTPTALLICRKYTYVLSN